MIKANLAFSDLVETPHWKDGKIHIGRSSISPYSHPALEVQTVLTKGRWFISVRERAENGSSRPSTSFEVVNEERFQQMHREALLWPLDYLMVEVAQDGCRVKLRAGVFGTAPVYCKATDSVLSISYDLADFFSQRMLLDTYVVSRRLAMHADYSSRQICTGIHLLTERAIIFACPGEFRYQYPSAVEPPTPSLEPAADGEARAFASWISTVTRARPVRPGRIAVELSGGMDSATVACALGDLSEDITGLGILIGSTNDQQSHRRMSVVDAIRLHDHTINISGFPPSLDLNPAENRPEYPMADFYLEAFEALWDTAAEHGCDLLFTGLGGDQLFPTYRNEPRPNNQGGNAIVAKSQSRAEGLLTAKALEASRTLSGLDSPPGPLQASVLASSLCQSPHLLRRGLWPVNPLADPRLAARCQKLPRHCRHERETMRRYLDVKLGKPIFARGYAKETFAPVLPGLISAQATRIAEQLEECALADLGLVDRQAALTLLDDLTRTQERALTAPMASFLWMERFVRQFS